MASLASQIQPLAARHGRPPVTSKLVGFGRMALLAAWPDLATASQLEATRPLKKKKGLIAKFWPDLAARFWPSLATIDVDDD